MANKVKEQTSFWKHEHPAYEWVALFVSLIIVAFMSGWVYLKYFDFAAPDMTIWTTHSKQATSTSKTTKVTTNEIDDAIKNNDNDAASTNANDFNDTDISDTALGL